jgi:hypothetical protein
MNTLVDPISIISDFIIIIRETNTVLINIVLPIAIAVCKEAVPDHEQPRGD